MIDQIIIFLTTNFFNKREKDNNFSMGDIKKYFIHKDNSQTLKIIIPGWSDGISWATKILVKRLLRRGHSCLVYSIPRTILPHDPSLAPGIFNLVKESMIKDIINLKTQNNFSKIDIIAPSLGVVIACLVANGSKDITNTFFLVPGSCLASSLWEGIKTRELKQIYETQGINREKLIMLWSSLAPKNNVGELRCKTIFIAISNSDKVIPYGYGKEFAELSKKLYPDTLIYENPYLGHYLTVLKYYLLGNELLG